MNKKTKKNSEYHGAYLDSLEKTIELNKLGVKLIRDRIPEIPFSPNNRILDVGCGISSLGKTFGNNVYGFDINPKSAARSRKWGMHANVGDAEKRWKYPDGYFDIVILSHIIEHVVNTDHLLQEAKRVLKKGGLVIVGTPNLAAWFNRLLLLFGFQPFFTEVSTLDKTLGLKLSRKINPKFSPPLGHLRVFTTGALKDILEMHEFKIIKMSGVEFYIFPKPLLFLDRLFSHNPFLASTIVVVGEKR